jgi:DNA-binding transcriptional MerR regulator
MSAEPVPGPSPDGLTVDQLAARVRMTVRNVRAYAARGLLPPPRLVGRTGYYGPEHVARLTLVREMLADGYPLAMIERTVASSPATSSTSTLALQRALLGPWLPPEPEVITTDELAERAGVRPEDGLVDELVELGLVTRLPDGRLRVLDPQLLQAGLQVVHLGVDPRALIAAQAQVNELVRSIAQTYVDMFRQTAWRTLLAEQDLATRLEQVRSAAARLQPAAAQALLASFRTEMAAAVARGLEQELEGDGPPGP